MRNQECGDMDIFSAGFWERSWKEAGKSSILSHTQQDTPERWYDFYNGVGGVYHDIWGASGTLGSEVANFFYSEKLINEKSSVLDMGCGPGTLAIPIAEKGATVLGIDYSPEMLKAFEKQAEVRKHISTGTVCCPFANYEPTRLFDLVVAAFFPPALNPSGLKRLESWATGYCAIVIGTGKEVVSFRKELWMEIMDHPMPFTGFHLLNLTGYLLAADRRPNLKHISWPFQFKCRVDDGIHFFKRYFSIFGKNDKRSETKIHQVIEKYSYDDLLSADGQMDICVVWWEPPENHQKAGG